MTRRIPRTSKRGCHDVIDLRSFGGPGQLLPGPRGDDYYLKGGEPPGYWLGDGASLLGLAGRVEEKPCKHLLAGLSPDGQDFLVQGAGGVRHQPGWDLSFSCPKSVTVIWCQGNPEIRKAVQEAQAEAVRAAVDYLQDAAACTRRGKGGRERETTKLVVAAFEHGTSRAQDPQLHTHCLVMNVGVRADGTTGTIVSQPLYAHKMAAGAVYRAELANQLEKRLGVVLEREKTWFDVQGVPESLAEEFETASAGGRGPGQGRRERGEGRRETDPRDKAGEGTPAVRRAGHLAEGRSRARLHGGGGGPAARAAGTPARPGRESGCLHRLAVFTITKQASHFPERELVRHSAVWASTWASRRPPASSPGEGGFAGRPSSSASESRTGETHYTMREEMLALEQKMLAKRRSSRPCPRRPLPRKRSGRSRKALGKQQPAPGM